MKKKLKLLQIALLALGTITALTSGNCKKTENKKEVISIIQENNDSDFKKNIGIVDIENIEMKNIKIKERKPSKIKTKEITISAIGDCTLGTDTNFGYDRSFTDVLDSNNRNFSYFFSGVSLVLENDDLTIANLETTFTDSNQKIEKKFNFKGDFDYTNILTEGSVEVVNLANNHTYDYGEEGFLDTKKSLKDANIPYFGYEDYSILEINNIRIGLAGLTGWDEKSAKDNTYKAIQYFHDNNTDLIIMTYHWGMEREYKQNAGQESIGRYAIDAGADLVIGHHPHVLQGIENYNGKYIVYSLGNFVFGGNRNPDDKDTMIFQETFYYENGILKTTSINIIPCSLSSRNDLNDYKPIILEGSEKKRILRKIMDSSNNLK